MIPQVETTTSTIHHKDKTMKFIADITEGLEVLSEGNAEGGKTWKLKGICLQSEDINRNGRKYPKSILEREVSKYNTEKVLKNRAIGELDHPEGPNMGLSRVSHKFTKLYAEGNNFIGEMTILDTPMGMVAQGLLKGGVQLGTSSRGMGSLKEYSGYKEVQEDFHLVTPGDLVSDPSAHEAWLNAIYENTDYFWAADGTIKSEIAATQAIADVEEAVRSRTLDADKKVEIFERYINNLLR